MRYEMRLTAYDMLDQVNITLHLEDTNGPSDAASSTALHMITAMRGKGLTEPREWVDEVLRTVQLHLNEKHPSTVAWVRPVGGSNTISGVADNGRSELT